MLKANPLKLKGVSKVGSISLSPNLGYPSLIVSIVFPMVFVVYYYDVHTTCSSLLFGFGKENGGGCKVILCEKP